jgi:iron complex outermembrane recepter protein
VQNDLFVSRSGFNPARLISFAGRTVSPAVVCTLIGAPALSYAEDQTAGTAPVAEVLVTAQKRVEDLQEVPVPVTVLNADSLADDGKVLIKDYYSSIPGLSLQPSILGTTNIFIRGINSGGGNPTIGILVDDVPFTASTNNFNAAEIPDFDPGDLARVETLRGPQGTLYGANAMGGLIKFVTKDPSTDAFSGRIEAGSNFVYNGNEPGYSLRGSANIPLTDTLAMRVSAFTRQDAGYIDNPVANVSGVNELKAYGARLAAAWKPSDDFTAKLSALYQRTKSFGSSEIDTDPGLGKWQQDILKNAGGYDRTAQAYALNLNYKFAPFDITSVTGYNITKTLNTFDYTNALGSFTQYGTPGSGFDGFGVAGTNYVNQFNLNKFTQELRVAATFGPVDLLVGGFYTRESLPGTTTFVLAEDTVTAKVAGIALANFYDGPAGVFEERAGFADLTYHFTDQFDVQLGARESWDKEIDTPTIADGPFVPAFYGAAAPFTTPQEEARGDAFTYLITPRYRVTQDLMIYARVASGFRPGGPNAPDRVAEGAPPSFAPDKTKNYEIGTKADLLNHQLTVDASVFYIDWKNLQLQLLDTFGNTYGANGGHAKSEGIELSVAARPMNNLSVSGWIDYTNAVLKDAMPSDSTVMGEAGDRLPMATKVSAHLAAEQDFALAANLQGFVGGEVSYVGSRLGSFQSTETRQVFPAYTKTDLSGGVKSDAWRAALYINNVGNVRGLLNGGAADLFNPVAFVYIQPRTVGLTFTHTF